MTGRGAMGMDGTEADRPSTPDAGWLVDAARVSVGLLPERAWRWCLLRTLRDMRLAARRGRPISRPNAERLFCRRWARATAHLAAGIQQENLWLVEGRGLVRRVYVEIQRTTRRKSWLSN